MPKEYWGMSLDDITEAMYQIPNDARGGHFIAFEGDQETARAKMIAAFAAFIDQNLYRATHYGYRWEEGDED